VLRQIKLRLASPFIYTPESVEVFSVRGKVTAKCTGLRNFASFVPVTVLKNFCRSIVNLTVFLVNFRVLADFLRIGNFFRFRDVVHTMYAIAH